MAISPIPAAARVKDYSPTVRVVTVTPSVAEEILERNTLNRPLKSGRVERYARDMKAGKWRMNAETIKITGSGELLDGQHRLFAVIESGCAIQAMIVEGLPIDVMPTIDTGAARTFGDVIGIRGGKNVLAVAAACRLLAWYESSPRPAAPPSYTHSELDGFLAKNQDIVDRVSEFGGSLANRRKVAPSSVVCFVYTLAARESTEKAAEWLELLGTGAGMESDHPVYQFRERMLSDRTSRAKLPKVDVCALCIKSWNLFVTGERRQMLTWRSTEPFPEVAAVGARMPRTRLRKMS